MNRSRLSQSIVNFGFVLGSVVAFSNSARADWYFHHAYVAWVTSTNLTGTAPGNPLYTDVDQSYTGGGVNVTQVATGKYTAKFLGLVQLLSSAGFPTPSSSKGNVQVTAFNSSARCKVSTWTVNVNLRDIDVSILCFSPTGAPVNSLFTASYAKRSDVPGPESAYVYDSSPSLSNWDASSSAYSYNSAQNGIFIIHAAGSGSYTVALLGQNGGTAFDPMGGGCVQNLGTVEVTATGTGPAYCKVADMFRVGNDTDIDVLCFNGINGLQTESAFQLAYGTLTPNGSWTAGYAFNQTSYSGTYNPPAPYSGELLQTGDRNSWPHCDIGHPSITHTNPITLDYTVAFGGLNVNFLGSSDKTPQYAKVTAVGADANTCNIMNFNTDPLTNSARLNVRCFTSAGQVTSSSFMVAYSSWMFDALL